MPFARLLRLVATVVAVVAVGSCTRAIDSPADAGTGSDSTLVSCTEVTDCPDPDPSRTRCNGICLTICNGADEACPLDSFCDATGTCARGCRDSSTCPEGQLCVNGNCSTQSAQCSSRCDCDPGEICKDGACQSPGASCTTKDDCPRGPADRCEAYQCNGFSRQCFDPDPQPCAAAADCAGRPGCTGTSICTCTSAGACVPDVVCTPQDERTTCGTGNFCDGTGRCQALTQCTQPSDCAPGLTCNNGSGVCERPQACTSSTQCGPPPATFCDATTGFCAIPNCINQGTTCSNGLVCSQGSGRCVTPGGAACTNDSACQPSEYCDIADQVCRTGCRSNADCASGQNCNGAHVCVGGGGGGGNGDAQFGELCTDDADCQAPMFCGPLTSTCAEPCSAPEDCIACNAVNGTCRCTGLGFCRAS
jgi:hypothetical protein